MKKENMVERDYHILLNVVWPFLLLRLLCEVHRFNHQSFRFNKHSSLLVLFVSPHLAYMKEGNALIGLRLCLNLAISPFSMHSFSHSLFSMTTCGLPQYNSKSPNNLYSADKNYSRGELSSIPNFPSPHFPLSPTSFAIVEPPLTGSSPIGL